MENIFLDNEGTIKIGDFGVSYKKPPPGEETKKKEKIGKVGTIAYWAPEICERGSAFGRQSEASDIWAAGVVLYIMVYGMMPFTSNGNNEDQLKKEISRSEVVYNASASDGCRAFLKTLLDKDIAKRPRPG